MKEKLYRSRSGALFGVCKGLALWLGIPPFPLRLAWAALALWTGFFPFVLLYLLLAYFLPEKPLFEEFSREERGAEFRGY